MRVLPLGRENLCDDARFTGYQLDGGYAELAVADERFCFPIPDGYPDLQAAPLLCAGLIGYRSLRLAGDGERLGPLWVRRLRPHRLPGRRASGPARLRASPGRGRRAQAFARELGPRGPGASDRRAGAGAPRRCDHLRPGGELVPVALRAVAPGGTVVCAGIHMSDIPSFPYESSGASGCCARWPT